MKSEQKQNLAVNLLILVLISLFIISISMMWLKHDQYHSEGASYGWMMSEQLPGLFIQYKDDHEPNETR